MTIFARIADALDTCPWWEYYYTHAIIALFIMGVIWPLLGLNAGMTAGVAFYIGHEVTDYMKGAKLDPVTGKHKWDHPGYLWPTCMCLSAWILLRGVV